LAHIQKTNATNLRREFMRRILAAAAMVVLGSVPAFAADAVMAGFYGNTVVVTGDGFQAHVHYRANHTLDISGTASGQAFSTKGSWKIDGKGQICRSYKTAVPTMANPLCTAAAAHKVGDTWTATTPTGSSRNITLVAGTQ
jgi:opacity protein-like surface antigen